MCTIQDIISTNFLLEDLKDQQKPWPVFDKSWLLGKDPSAVVNSKDIRFSSFVVGVAEVVNFVAAQGLFDISWLYRGSANVLSDYALTGIMWICFHKNYTQEDVEKFDQRKTYIEYFKAKAELVACLSAKEQACWIAKECYYNTIYKIIGAAIILTAPQQPRALLSLHKIAAKIISWVVVMKPFYKLVDWVDLKLHATMYHLAEKNQAQLS